MTKNGLYLIASLNGEAASPHDVAAMFGPNLALSGSDGCVLLGCERGNLVQPSVGPSSIRLLLGQVDSLSGPPQDAANAIAARFSRSGVDADCEGGEWLFADWDRHARKLTLAASECLGDPCFVAVEGQRVAVAPDLPSLARIGWVDETLDSEALVRAMRTSGADPRNLRKTLLRQVVRLLPGEKMVVSAHGIAIDAPVTVPPPQLRQVGFADAIAELDTLLRQIMRRTLARSGDVAVLLSGGLDSSLIAALAAEERLPGQRVICLTSAAPPGSGIKDETEWASMVANHLGLPIVRVAPDPEATIYSLPETHLKGATGPIIAPLHFLHDAFEDAARAAEANLMIDGGFGELTVSAYGQRQGGNMLTNLRRQVSARLARGKSRSDDFFVRPSAAALALCPIQEHPWQAQKGHPEACGFALGFDKAALRTTDAVDPRLRRAYPFRDRALGKMMAAFPVEYLTWGGMDRAPIRALLAGRVPDLVVRRKTKQPFSPTYFQFLAAQASSARALIPAQRLAGADEWLDLTWLDQQLEAAASGATLSRDIWSQVHCTTLFAEFIRWWNTERT